VVPGVVRVVRPVWIERLPDHQSSWPGHGGERIQEQRRLLSCARRPRLLPAIKSCRTARERVTADRDRAGERGPTPRSRHTVVAPSTRRGRRRRVLVLKHHRERARPRSDVEDAAGGVAGEASGRRPVVSRREVPGRVPSRRDGRQTFDRFERNTSDTPTRLAGTRPRSPVASESAPPPPRQRRWLPSVGACKWFSVHVLGRPDWRHAEPTDQRWSSHSQAWPRSARLLAQLAGSKAMVRASSVRDRTPRLR
jgi:hypothetical protein